MKSKSTEIVIQFKHMGNMLYSRKHGGLKPNLLTIKVQPQEGMLFQINGKEPGTLDNILPVKMNFCQNCEFDTNTPEAYEKLLLDVMKGDSTLFTRWDELEYSWKFIDKILKTWNENSVEFPNYKPGSYGPKEADELLGNDNRKWWNVEESESCILGKN
jgi:glucose-6-phosphate 1-dehydrogenase